MPKEKPRYHVLERKRDEVFMVLSHESHQTWPKYIQSYHKVDRAPESLIPN